MVELRTTFFKVPRDTSNERHHNYLGMIQD